MKHTYGIAVCGQTERVLLSLIEDWGAEEVLEELERLSLCIKGEAENERL